MAVWLLLLRLIAMTFGSGLHGASLYGMTDKSLNCSLPVNFNCPFGQIYGFWLAIKLTAEKRTPQFKLFHLTSSLLLQLLRRKVLCDIVYVVVLDVDLLLIGTYSDRDNHTVRGHKLVFCVAITCFYGPLRILVQNMPVYQHDPFSYLSWRNQISSVCTATGCWSEFDSLRGKEVFLFCTASRQTLEPTCLLSNGHWGFFLPWWEVKTVRAWSWPMTSIVELKKWWSRASIPHASSCRGA
jgi:hypothetical protein